MHVAARSDLLSDHPSVAQEIEAVQSSLSTERGRSIKRGTTVPSGGSGQARVSLHILLAIGLSSTLHNLLFTEALVCRLTHTIVRFTTPVPQETEH